MKSKLIEARVLKGFKDTLPNIAIKRNEIISVMQDVFKSFGLVPIDTPALEYSEILLGKGSDETDKQMYRFKDAGDRDVSLRFDLTIPFARFSAMHINSLGTPFKRFHIAPVWRAEKPQKGRYREFIQCDFDIIGSTSIVSDGEVLAIVGNILEKLQLESVIRVNSRKILNGFYNSLGSNNKSTEILRAVDKLEKLGKEVVYKELVEEAKLNDEQCAKIFDFLSISNGDNQEIIKKLQKLLSNNEQAIDGITELKRAIELAEALGVSKNKIKIDLSIARGLDYYTGIVFETNLLQCPELGSICSGGRYDNLAGLYTKKELPGVGGSFGLDRLLSALEEQKEISDVSNYSKVLVSVTDENTILKSAQIAGKLRNVGINCELYHKDGKLKEQLKYANKKNIPYVIITGEKEFGENRFSLKDMNSGEQLEELEVDEIANIIKQNQ